MPDQNQLSKNTWDWITHNLPKPNQNQIVRKTLETEQLTIYQSQIMIRNKLSKKQMRLYDSQATTARSESESNCQKILETEQLTIYQSQIRIRIKFPTKILWTKKPTGYPSQIRIRIKLSRNTWDWTTHNLPNPYHNHNQIVTKTLETELTGFQSQIRIRIKLLKVLGTEQLTRYKSQIRIRI